MNRSRGVQQQRPSWPVTASIDTSQAEGLITENASDKRLRLGSFEANTNGVVIACTTTVTNFDIVIPSENGGASTFAQRDVVGTGGVPERVKRQRQYCCCQLCSLRARQNRCRLPSYEVPVSVDLRCQPACRRIAVTTCVGKQGLKPVGRVVAAGGVVRKRKRHRWTC